jgi:hypothetical protein
MIIEWSRYLALILMLLAVVYGYRKGRNASVVSGQSLAWTNIPLIALAIISIGPSIYAVILYLTYRFGWFSLTPLDIVLDHLSIFCLSTLR